ncbi:MAG: PSD1 and planctomycete cytochrome C domain-containing protein [Planctomycetota bacterium]
MKTTPRALILLQPLLLLCCHSLAAQEVDFQRDVAPILEERCTFCHGAEEAESGLRLDLRHRLLSGGDSGLAGVVPGNPEKSYLLEVIQHLDPAVKMPPDEDKLPQKEIDTIRRWIAQGAIWPGQMEKVESEEIQHWSFLPVQRPAVPDIAELPNPIDRFLTQKLAEKGLAFSSEADPVDLIRRSSIVLTGLAPTPEETDRFLEAYVQDSNAAFERLIDRLMASPHFGERFAQHWLDAIRWAETNGSEANLYRKNAWIYRDYVVRAFNEDKPYDEFVQEQIAGDSMGAGEATGFLVAGPHVPAATVGREPSAIRQARADRMDEIMQTVGSSIMAVTVGCARCHNHKFDPITITDYYAMTGVFQGVEFGSRYPEFSEEHPRRQRGQELWKEIEKNRQVLRPTGGWEENWGAYRELHFKPTKTKAVRFRFKSHNVNLDELEVFGTKNRNVNLGLPSEGTKLSGFPELGKENRNPLHRVVDGEYGTMAWRASVNKDGEERPWVVFEFSEKKEVNRLRLSSNREYFYDTDYLTQKPFLPRYEFDLDIQKEDGTWQPLLGTWYVNKKLNELHPERKPAINKIQKQIEFLAEEGPRPSFVGRFVKPKPTFVLLRGSPESPRDEVAPAGPALLQGDLGLDMKAAGSKRRAEFAKWITTPENPLTARVMVNRLWHHIFGAGIVTTTGDFGTAGARPSHPELLDWLAAEFVQPGDSFSSINQGKQDSLPKPWSVKNMVRMMVLSKAFRQSSLPKREALAKDAGSTLLWRFPPKRVEAEVIRDSILLASGALDERIGGRSYRIHNEKKTYAQWEVVNNHGPETWRRMLYQERMRRVDDGMFTAFDFPDCGQVRAKRPISTTPLQALNLMNSSFVMEQAQMIAKRVTNENDGGLGDAVDACFRLLLSRHPVAEEKESCVAFATSDGLPELCRALINSNEFAFLP